MNSLLYTPLKQHEFTPPLNPSEPASSKPALSPSITPDRYQGKVLPNAHPVEVLDAGALGQLPHTVHNVGRRGGRQQLTRPPPGQQQQQLAVAV
jgi:hypothetical protein